MSSTSCTVVALFTCTSMLSMIAAFGATSDFYMGYGEGFVLGVRSKLSCVNDPTLNKCSRATSEGRRDTFFHCQLLGRLWPEAGLPTRACLLSVFSARIYDMTSVTKQLLIELLIATDCYRLNRYRHRLSWTFYRFLFYF